MYPDDDDEEGSNPRRGAIWGCCCACCPRCEVNTDEFPSSPCEPNRSGSADVAPPERARFK